MDYTQRIDSLFNRFNNIFDEQMMEESKLKEFVPEVRQKRIIEWRQKKMDVIGKEALELHASLKSELISGLKKIPSLKYPLRFGNTTSDKQLGETIRSNAFAFINSTKDLASIKNEIQFSFDTGTTDYFSSLIDVINSRRPDQIGLSRLPKEERDFYLFTDELQKKFESDKNISAINQETEKLKSSLKEVEFFQSDFETSEMLIPLRTAKQLSASELSGNKTLLDAANKAMFYFKEG